MKIIQEKLFMGNRSRPVLFSFIFSIFLSLIAEAQEPPPVVNATVSQNLSFGAFTASPGIGSVTILTNGSRVTNNVLGIGGPTFINAIYSVSTNRQALLSILKGPDVTLTAPGGSMTLHIGDTDPASPFLVMHPPGYIDIKVGGTLNVGTVSANPPGNYTGTFYITFIWE
jgi:hypothetical protein